MIVRIVTDSACDLRGNEVTELGIEVVPLSIRFGTEEFVDREELTVEDFYRRLDEADDLPETAAPSPGRFEQAFTRQLNSGADTVVCINVPEHIRDDRGTLRNFHEVLRPGGRLVLLVPAIPLLFSTLDEALDHHRRYTRPRLVHKMEGAGFRLIESRYLNFFGIAGWILSGKILRRRILPSTLLGLFNTLVPAFRAFERLTGPPIGLSVIAVGEKT